MGNNKLRGKDLKAIAYVTSKEKSMALDIISKHYKYASKEEKLQVLSEVMTEPERFQDDEVWAKLAEYFLDQDHEEIRNEIQLKEEAELFRVFGRQHITSNAYQQMEWAMRLPVAAYGALMPDAHMGYGLPIGGVLATQNAVIPYGVGVDIGCRMSLSLFDVDPKYLERNSYQFKLALKEKTNFGSGGILNITQEHEVLDSPVFAETPLLKQLHGKAVQQLGTSGSGNHFVEFGSVRLYEGNELGFPAGEYLGLLSHSGSLGLGAAVARHYTDLAQKECLLPKHVQHLAWLDMNADAGREYWLSMNLAGDYAKACHDQIHYHLSRYLGLDAILTVENHHNFAWREKGPNGEELIVHRKGATPAAKGELGIIPGSMATNGYIVRGKGETSSLNSASHGAGRKMSRSKVKNSYTKSALNKYLSQERVTLIGGGVDEAPIAYKNIDEVMASQKELVDVIGEFKPMMVRMDKG